MYEPPLGRARLPCNQWSASVAVWCAPHHYSRARPWAVARPAEAELRKGIQRMVSCGPLARRSPALAKPGLGSSGWANPGRHKSLPKKEFLARVN